MKGFNWLYCVLVFFFVVPFLAVLIILFGDPEEAQD